MVKLPIKPNDLLQIVKRRKSRDDDPEHHMSDFLISRPKGRGSSGDSLGWSHVRQEKYPVKEIDPNTGKAIDADRMMRDITALKPTAEGSGWTQNTKAPKSKRWRNKGKDPKAPNPDEPTQEAYEVYEPPIIDDKEYGDPEKDADLQALVDWLKQYEEWEPDAIRSIMNTDRHETGHGATKNLYDLAGESDPMQSQKDPVIPHRNTSIDAEYQDEEEAKTLRMLAQLDDDRLARIGYREQSYENPVHRRTEENHWGPSGWHEYAAYLSELPNHPAWAFGKWLKHRDVEQSQRRNALKRLAEAQKKWGEDPVDWKNVAEVFNPKGDRWGSSVRREVKDIMGKYPELRPAMPLGERVDDRDWQPEYENPEKAKKFLMPAGERIYRNLREAIIGQTYGAMAAAKDFPIDPEGIANQKIYQSARNKMAERQAKEALTLLNRHFTRVRQGKEEMPKTIKDLPEALRGEIARLELRRILAEQVGRQNKLEEDRDWQDPDTLIDIEWTPRTERFDFDRNRYRSGQTWIDTLANRIGLNEKGRAQPGSDARYIPEEGAWAELKRFLLEDMKSRNEKWNEENPDYGGGWYGMPSDPETKALRARFNDDEEAYRKWSKEHGEAYRENQTQMMESVQDKMDELGLSDFVGRRGTQMDEWGDYLQYPTLNLPRYYPPSIYNPSGEELFAEYPKDPNAPLEWDEDAYDSIEPSERVYLPSSYYGIIPKRRADELKQGKRIWNQDTGYGRQGSPEWLKDDKSQFGYEYNAHLRDDYDPIRDVWLYDDPDNWQDHPLANKIQMTPRVKGFRNPEKWALETKYPWNQNIKRWQEWRKGVRRSPFSQAMNQKLIDEERQRLEDAGKHVPSDWRYKHTFEGIDDEGEETWFDSDTVAFKRRGGKERERPMKRVPLPRYEWDPVERAIAQAFMDREMERVPGELNEETIQRNKDAANRAMERNQEYNERRGITPADVVEQYRTRPAAGMRERMIPIAGRKWTGEIPITHDSEIPDFVAK